ncbi:hypothetical protein A0128_05990 [Leptospira tipperaryensis]|uniref:Uncharacterized protein n=1 Tax=Leptospira tipperaryensis TaxID=2564040 RepID=A0A1D7UV02_9LEPT|nr:hypothetical protein A0128_05990 [Leptospira tipperaryensis]
MGGGAGWWKNFGNFPISQNSNFASKKSHVGTPKKSFLVAKVMPLLDEGGEACGDSGRIFYIRKTFYSQIPIRFKNLSRNSDKVVLKLRLSKDGVRFL